VDKRGRHKRLASEVVNLTQFANITPTQTQLTIEFQTLSKKIRSASLTLTISSLFLCAGNATYDTSCALHNCADYNDNDKTVIMTHIYTFGKPGLRVMTELRFPAVAGCEW